METTEACMTLLGAQGFVSKELEQSEDAEEQILKAYFLQSEYEDRTQDIIAWLEERPHIQYEVRTVHQEDWANCWKEFFAPLELEGGILINPAWEPVDPNTAQHYRALILIDPGMAFGTGQHPTTSLCMEALGRLDLDKRRLLDVGTGSGILSICAAKLGAGDILALDNDPDCAAVVRANMDLNQLDPDRIDVRTATTAQIDGSWDILVANITAEANIELIPDYRRLCGNLLILSGILSTREKQVRKALKKNGFRFIDTRHDSEGEWCCILAEA